MSVKQLLTFACLAPMALFGAGCTAAPERPCMSLDGGKTLSAECCTTSGSLREELITYSTCSVGTAPAPVSDLITKCGVQGPPGGGVMSGLASGFGQGLAAITTNMELAKAYVGDKEGVDSDGAKDDGFFTPTNTGGGGGPDSPGLKVPPSGSNASNNSGLPSAGGGGGSGSMGGGKTAAATLVDPNAQLGMQADSDGASYASSGGGGGARARGGSSGGGNPLSSMIQSLMGGPGGGAGGAAKDPNAMQRYGAQSGSGGAAGVNVVGPGQDPEDYFTRVDPNASLFRIVEKRYEQTSLKGQIR